MDKNLKNFVNMVNEGIVLLRPEMEKENICCGFFFVENEQASSSVAGEAGKAIESLCGVLAGIYKEHFKDCYSLEEYISDVSESIITYANRNIKSEEL